MTAAILAIQLVLTIGIGFFAIRCHIVSENFEKQLTSLIMKIILPCMIIKSMSGIFSLEELKNCGLLILISIIFWLLSFALGELAFHALGRNASARIMRFGMIYTNFTFIGIPVVEALYGDLGVFYLVVFLVPYRMIYYSSAEPLLSPPGLSLERKSLLTRLKGWFSPPVVAVFIGLFLYLTQLQLPAPVSNVINSLGSCASPLGTLLCGMSLSKYSIRKLLRPRYMIYPAIRNILLPAISLALVLLCGLKKELAQIVVMFAALPIATMTAAYVIQYDPDENSHFEAAAAVLLSTVLSALTIPLWAALLTVFYP